MSRRRLLASAGGATLGAAALSIVGCGDDDKPPPTSGATPAGATQAAGSATATRSASTAAAGSPSAAAAQPKKGGQLTISHNPIGTETMDPHRGTFVYTIWSLIGDCLVETNPKTAEVEGSVISKWEFPQPNQLLLTVRDGVKFHEGKGPNGRAVTAEDVVFNVMRMGGKLEPDKA